MGTTSVWRRLGLWRLTRNPVAVYLYDRLTAAGVRLGRLDRYVRSTGVVDDPLDPDVVEEIRVRRAAAGVPAALADDPVDPADRILSARLEGRRVGYCVLSDRPVTVPALDRELTFPGAYVWRVYVEPAERGRGIGTALVAAAVSAGSTEFGADTVSALIAPDNVPSRRAFHSMGFERRKRYATVGVRGWTWRRGPATPEHS